MNFFKYPTFFKQENTTNPVMYTTINIPKQSTVPIIKTTTPVITSPMINSSSKKKIVMQISTINYQISLKFKKLQDITKVNPGGLIGTLMLASLAFYFSKP